MKTDCCFVDDGAGRCGRRCRRAPHRGGCRRTTTPRDRFADLSVGSDYPGTLIRDDSLAQLKTAKDELGFRYIRFHAIFHDVLGTYKEVDGKPVYDWTKLDYLYDRLLKMGVKPFVELGFTPLAMRSSDLSIFYWKGNTSHPDPKKWAGLVDAFVRHVQDRYGKEEVRSWFFEVWNEPNLDGFWEKADQKAYFELFDITSRTIKAIDPALRVGGRRLPARPGCRSSWRTPRPPARWWTSSPPILTAWMAASSTRMARTTPSCRRRRTPSWATCARCAMR
jgi:beta-xylosidase